MSQRVNRRARAVAGLSVVVCAALWAASHLPSGIRTALGVAPRPVSASAAVGPTPATSQLDDGLAAVATVTTITSHTPSVSVTGQTVTVAFRVSSIGGGTPTGAVNVTGTGTSGCSGTLSSGVGSCQLVFTSVAVHTLTVTYAGNRDYYSSTASTTHQVMRASTTTTITGDGPDPSVVGQAVAVSVSVVANAPGAGTPAGTVSVTGVDTTGCTVTLSGGSGSCTLSFTAAAIRQLTATYSGSSDYVSSSDFEVHTINRAGTTTKITSASPDPSALWQSVTVGVSVAANAPGAGVPSGSVFIGAAGTTGCTVTLAGGSGACALVFTSVGAKTLTAYYNGDSNFTASSATKQHTVGRADPEVILAGDSPDPSVVGEPVFVYFVVLYRDVSVQPSGSVMISGPDTTGCTGTLGDSAPEGSCSLVFTAPGVKALTATYGGDGNYNNGMDTEPHTVNKAGTTILVTNDSPDPSVVGELVYIHFSLAANAPGGGVPTGNVSLSTDSFTCNLNYQGTPLMCAMPFSIAGTRVVTATYSGNANYSASTDTEPHSVTKGNSITTITLDDPDPSLLARTVTVNVSVRPALGTSPFGMAGSVTVGGPDTGGCNAPLVNRDASCTLVFSAAGVKTLTATYSGDANYNASSDTEMHTVTGPVTQTPTPTATGTPTATATSVPSATGTPTAIATATRTATAISVPSATGTPTATATPTSVPSATATPTSVPSATGTATATAAAGTATPTTTAAAGTATPTATAAAGTATATATTEATPGVIRRDYRALIPMIMAKYAP